MVAFDEKNRGCNLFLLVVLFFICICNIDIIFRRTVVGRILGIYGILTIVDPLMLFLYVYI